MGRKWLGSDPSNALDFVTKAITDALATRVTNLENTVPPFVAGQWKQHLVSSYAVTATTNADLTGVTVTVPVTASTDQFEVTFCGDLLSNVASPGTLVVRLWVDGQQQTQEMDVVRPVVGMREPVSRVWQVTGVASGNRVFKITAHAPAGSYSFYGTHTQLMVTRTG